MWAFLHRRGWEGASWGKMLLNYSSIFGPSRVVLVDDRSHGWVRDRVREDVAAINGSVKPRTGSFCDFETYI